MPYNVNDGLKEEKIESAGFVVLLIGALSLASLLSSLLLSSPLSLLRGNHISHCIAFDWQIA